MFTGALLERKKNMEQLEALVEARIGEDANIKRLYPYSEPIRPGNAWKDWVVDMESQFGTYGRANGIYDAIIFSLQDLKPESSV
ncbi:hypothetical protein L3X38_043185 [Prunus dulcis]|uniref:Uncharacterized protein n=2 Tax=Prunus dulcis TaxID=3755 RepID=A0AAD4UWD0_PRUDU|nr:hypothetical protein L3X38_043185 [Prunus dulcis]